MTLKKKKNKLNKDMQNRTYCTDAIDITKPWNFKGFISNDNEIPNDPKPGEYYNIKGDWHSDKLAEDLKNYDSIYCIQTKKGIKYYILRYDDLKLAHEVPLFPERLIKNEAEIAIEKDTLVFKGDITCDGDFPKKPKKGYLYRIVGDKTLSDEEKAKGLIVGKPKPWYSKVLRKMVYDEDIFCYCGNKEKWFLVIGGQNTIEVI